MSAKGKEIPYQLRPNKFIDRQLFLDSLSRILPNVGVEKYCYISMGGKHLSDHHAVYKKVGVKALCSFDSDNNIVARQLENRPRTNSKCIVLEADEIPEHTDQILSDTDTENTVVWLDYTDKNRRAQVQNFKRLLTTLSVNDIARITLNATGEDTTNFRKEGYSKPGEYLAKLLKEQLEEFIPPNTVVIESDKVPDILLACIRNATEKAQLECRNIIFLPILLTQYADGAKMVTATILVTDDRTHRKQKDALSSWEFSARQDWSNIERIEAPDLSQREKSKIDKDIDRHPSTIQKKLGFFIGDSKATTINAIKSYRRYHRYYPSFHNVEV